MSPTPSFTVLGITAALTFAGATSGQQFVDLPVRRHLPARLTGAQVIAVGDVDGDGDVDLVLGGSELLLYRNDGDGVFTDVSAAQILGSAAWTRALALGDVDGDGDLDLVIGNMSVLPGSGQNRLFVNDGGGTFRDATQNLVPAQDDSTNALALVDVDGDGDLDLWTANGNNLRREQNRLYRNDGSGIFQDVTAGRVPVRLDATSALAVGDVDGDGDRDIVFGNQYGEQNRLLVNNGSGFFSDGTGDRLPKSADDTDALALGDVDGDGDLDLVVGEESSRNRLYLNDGTGGFANATAGRLPWRMENTLSVALTDLDGDGALDLVVGARGSNAVYQNDGSGVFRDVTPAWWPTESVSTFGVAVADLDGDSDRDVLLANCCSERPRLYFNDGTGVLIDATPPRLPLDSDRTESVAFGDVDGDGAPDLVLGNDYLPNRLYRNDGTGIFVDDTAASLVSIADSTRVVVLGDVDGDGDPDLLVGNCCGPTAQNRLFSNDGTGVFTDVTAARLPVDADRTQTMQVGDVDGDGDADLVIGNEKAQNRLYLNDGTGTFGDVTATHLPPDTDYTYALVLGDVDGDGDPDLVIGNRGQNRLYRNDGAGAFTDVTAQSMPADSDSTQALALGDVDGDGDPDLVIGSCCGASNRLYLNDGSGAFTDATAQRLPVVSNDTHALALADVDGDGDLDLVIGNGGLTLVQNRLYLNDGSGTFADVTAQRLPVDKGGTRAVAVADIDLDGDLDLAFGNASDNYQNRLYVNLHRQLETPLVAVLGRGFTVVYDAAPGYAQSGHVGVAVLGNGLAPVPFSLPGLGVFVLDPALLLPLPVVVIPQAPGTVSSQLTIPANPSLVGRTFYLQGLIAGTGAPVSRHLTGYLRNVVLR